MAFIRTMICSVRSKSTQQQHDLESVCFSQSVPDPNSDFLTSADLFAMVEDPGGRLCPPRDQNINAAADPSDEVSPPGLQSAGTTGDPRDEVGPPRAQHVHRTVLP